MTLKRVSLELAVEVTESDEDTEFAQAYGKFIERVAHGDYGKENIRVEDI